MSIKKEMEAQMQDVRTKGAQILSLLENQKLYDRSNYIYDSWVRGRVDLASDSLKKNGTYPSKRCQFFDVHGFIFVPSFSDKSEVEAMKLEMNRLVEEQWFPGEEKEIAVFRTDKSQIDAQGSNDYFLESASKVHFFAEKDAMNEDSGKIKEAYAQNKMSALNKVGHGLHINPGVFHSYTTSQKIKELVRELGWKHPIVPQSMYIFKQPKIGGEVTSHQDSTFLYTTPKQTCLGLWLALDDATLENGCLWVRPSSHLEPVRRKFAKNPNHFGIEAIHNRSNVANGDLSNPQMKFEKLTNDEIPWEGKLPEGSDQLPYHGLFEAGFVPIECKAGDLLVFSGQLDHLSLPNYSNNQRHTFQLHLVEGKEAGVIWDQSNWLQYPSHLEFLKI